MKKYISILFLVFFVFCDNDEKETINSQLKGEKKWSTTIGGSGDDTVKQVIATKDGGFLVVGYTKSSDGEIVDHMSSVEEAWLSKFNASGHLLWSKTFGGMMDDYAYSAVEDSDGNFVVAGYSMSMNEDVPMNLGMHDFWIFKVSSQGNLIWSKIYGYTSHDHAHKIIATNDGGYFVVGFTDYSGGIGNRLSNSNSIQHGVGEYYGLKLNNDGEKEWDAYFGGTQNERVFDVVEANDGGFVLVGYSESSDFDVTDNKGSYDYWVIKLNATGQLNWKKSYGGSDIDQAFGIVKINNNYIIAGTSNSQDGDVSNPKGESDIWIVAIDNFGNIIWDKSIGGAQNDLSNALLKTNSNEIIITGHTRTSDIFDNKGQNDVLVASISSGGQIKWIETFGGSSFDFGVSAAQLKDNSIVVVADTQSNDYDIAINKGQKDILIINIK